MSEENKDIEHEYTEEIVCPWCGYETGDSWECSDEGEEECPECQKKFNYSRNIQVSYSSWRSKCDKCDYELDKERFTGNPYLYSDRNWTIWKCKVCENEIVKAAPIAEDGKPYVIPLELSET